MRRLHWRQTRAHSLAVSYSRNSTLGALVEISEMKFIAFISSPMVAFGMVTDWLWLAKHRLHMSTLIAYWVGYYAINIHTIVLPVCVCKPSGGGGDGVDQYGY